LRRRRARSALVVAALLAFGCDAPAAGGAAASATATASSQPRLDQAAVDEVVAKHAAELANECLGARAPIELQLILEVDAAGKVTDAAAAGGGAGEKELRRCIDDRMLGWQFPATGQAKTVTASLKLPP
jgi:hypothetical protein